MSKPDMESFKAKPASTAPVRKYAPPSVVYWMRLGLGILAGALSYVLHLKGLLGIVLAAAIYLASCGMVQYGLRYGETELRGKNKLLVIGVGTYIFTWAAVWVFLYTVGKY